MSFKDDLNDTREVVVLMFICSSFHNFGGRFGETMASQYLRRAFGVMSKFPVSDLNEQQEGM